MPDPIVKTSLSATELVASLVSLEGWRLSGDGALVAIEKDYRFENFHDTMAFVNAVAFVAHTRNHHPDLSVHFNRCTVAWSTHDVGGISPADLDCAARTDALLAPDAA
jgi:4a-hydroxytetrahydrobiopterin dehydratase